MDFTPGQSIYPLIIGHRGIPARYPENTLASFAAAMEAGALACECDVHCTADGHVVVSHDSNLRRTTDMEGEIREMTLEQVRRADAGIRKDSRFAGERIPTLVELMDLVGDRMRIVIEVKAEGICPRVVETLEKCGGVTRVNLASFHLGELRQAAKLAPRTPRGWIHAGLKEDDPAAAEELVRTAVEAGMQFLSVYHGGIQPSLLRQAYLAGMGVWSWTVNDPALMRQQLSQGVVGVTTDDVEVLFGALKG